MIIGVLREARTGETRVAATPATVRPLLGLGYRVAVPVIEGPERPLAFRLWSPEARTERGAFGVEVPVGGEAAEPEVLLVPLLAFDARGHRLGYGGGFYDRTLAGLRARGPVLAIGFAWAAQEDPALPLEATDAPLDLVVTEAEVIGPFGR